MTDEQTKSAGPIRREGRDAYREQGHRRSISTNPYRFGSPEWVAWREGYADAEGEHIQDLTSRGL